MRVVGVYMLLAGDEVVYVGQSVDVRSRLSDHLRWPPRAFDRALVLPCGADDLRAVEAALIRWFMPSGNRIRTIFVGEDEALASLGLPPIED
ncbi:MAG TPA: GIY-YIG nuclease family protein [Kofleriaceae bacterium]